MKEALVALIFLAVASWLYQDEISQGARYWFPGKYQDRVPIATWTNDTTLIKECK